MSRGGTVGPVEASVGYVLKEVSAALRTAMEATLAGYGLSVPQYVCLELLSQQPGLSNADLARGAFVTRQSMNLVLRGLEGRGLLTRPDVADQGRSRPSHLTPAGRRLLRPASTSIRSVERQMLTGLDTRGQRRLLHDLKRCAAALAVEGATDPVSPTR